MKRKKHPRRKRKLTKDVVSRNGVSKDKKKDLTVEDLIRVARKANIAEMGTAEREKLFHRLKTIAVTDRIALQDEIEQRILAEQGQALIEYPHKTGEDFDRRALNGDWEKSPAAQHTKRALPDQCEPDPNDLAHDPFHGAQPTQKAMERILERQINDAIYHEDAMQARKSAELVRSIANRDEEQKARTVNKQTKQALQQVNVNVDQRTQPPVEVTPQQHSNYANQVRQAFHNEATPPAAPPLDPDLDATVEQEPTAACMLPSPLPPTEATPSPIPNTSSQETQP